MHRTSRVARRQGFTIIELLIVVIVIGVLASAGVAKYQGFAESARQKTCISNQATIENAGAIWQTQNTTARDDSWGAGIYRKDGYYWDTWGSGFPWRSGFAIADIVRDPKTFVCPRELQDRQGYQNIPNGQYAPGAGSCGWLANYVHYYHGTNPGTATWMYWLWYMDQGNQTAQQMVFCPGWGMYACVPAMGSKYKHANKWN